MYKRIPPLFLRPPLLVVALTACLAVTATADLSARQAGAQRYPRSWNEDGTARCYPDGCDLFGPCCS